MQPLDRRHWNLQAIKILSRYGIEIAILRRTIGTHAFNDRLDEAFREAPLNPEQGARIFLSKLPQARGRAAPHQGGGG
jgi:hypothetical protein